MENRTLKFLKSYLEAIGINENDYQCITTQDTLGYLIVLTFSKENKSPSIGVLFGRNGRNLRILKQLLRVVGFSEKILPFLVIKMT